MAVADVGHVVDSVQVRAAIGVEQVLHPAADDLRGRGSHAERRADTFAAGR